MNPLQQIEQEVLAEGREWTRRRLEEQLQQQADAMPAVCPISGEALRDTRWRDFELNTVAGTITIRARYGYSRAQKRWVFPVRAAWGLESYQRLSPELQQRLCYTATEVSSYERAAAMEKAGAPLGSGAMESQNSQWQRRFKTCGQFWRRRGLAPLLALSVLFQNRDQSHLWN